MIVTELGKWTHIWWIQVYCLNGFWSTYDECQIFLIDTEKDFADTEMRQLVLWENMCADEYVRQKQTKHMECEEFRIRTIGDRSVAINIAWMLL